MKIPHVHMVWCIYFIYDCNTNVERYDVQTLYVIWKLNCELTMSIKSFP